MQAYHAAIISVLKNSLAVKEGAALFKMASVKKVMKPRGQPKNGCDGIGVKSLS